MQLKYIVHAMSANEPAHTADSRLIACVQRAAGAEAQIRHQWRPDPSAACYRHMLGELRCRQRVAAHYDRSAAIDR